MHPFLSQSKLKDEIKNVDLTFGWKKTSLASRRTPYATATPDRLGHIDYACAVSIRLGL